MENNLDRLAVECAQEIVKGVSKEDVKTLYNLSTKTLGVLQEQGIYAMVLFLLSRTADEEKRTAKVMSSSLYDVLKKVPHFNEDIPSKEMKPSEILEKYCKMTEKLEKLLLVRTLYERTLIYTRYSAKAAQEESKGEGGER